MVGNFVNTHGHALRVYVCFAFVVETFQFPSGGNEDKKFHIEAIPARNVSCFVVKALLCVVVHESNGIQTILTGCHYRFSSIVVMSWDSRQIFY